ncbi:cytochrome P460 family protein [Vibrio amylolyticus]|uniref:cytochrome P460 family protein n=1 Tax=Vibrio amylolyticus TaxID=2847292 RepID=UPI00354F7AB3
MLSKYTFLTITLLTSSFALADISKPTDTYKELVDKTGAITFPADFQTQLVHVGTTVVLSEEKVTPQNINGIYTQKEAIDAYNKTGQWPDGTLFVKDVKLTKGERLTTGAVFHQRGNDVFFVMIKDTEGRFTDNVNWGDGWGWAMFDAEPKQNVSPNKEFCQGCHAPRQSNDWLYTDQYPSIVKEFF